jgi:hypothetical protein
MLAAIAHRQEVASMRLPRGILAIFGIGMVVTSLGFCERRIDMTRMQSSIVIARPVEEVFAFFLALDESARQTDPSVESVIKTPDGPPGAGTTFRLRQHNLGEMRETTTRFTAVEPDRKIEFEAEIGPMRPRCQLLFEPAGEGTRVTFGGDSNPIGPLKILSPVFNRKGQQVWGGDWRG